MEDTLQFKISSALKDLVGKDLITSDNVAIFELVKNSYDAYANHVVITFSEDKITIADNGKGMSYSDLINKWLFLGFSAKKDGSEDLVDEKQKSYRDKIKVSIRPRACFFPLFSFLPLWLHYNLNPLCVQY